MEHKSEKVLSVIIKKLSLYLLGLIGTCYGVAIILKTNWGLDAWNSVFAGLEKSTPFSLGTWAIIIQSAFLILTAVLNKEIDWFCAFPNVFKGLFLDFAKTCISCISIPSGFVINTLVFISGYFLVAIGTGVYIATGYPKMPIDGLMTALSHTFFGSIKRARLLIELCGFISMFLVHGPFGFGTIIITFTIGHVISVSQSFADTLFLKRLREN